MDTQFLFLMSISDGSVLGVAADATADVGLVGYEMALLVSRTEADPHAAADLGDAGPAARCRADPRSRGRVRRMAELPPLPPRHRPEDTDPGRGTEAPRKPRPYARTWSPEAALARAAT
jgi:hypothetical protein